MYVLSREWLQNYCSQWWYNDLLGSVPVNGQALFGARASSDAVITKINAFAFSQGQHGRKYFVNKEFGAMFHKNVTSFLDDGER